METSVARVAELGAEIDGSTAPSATATARAHGGDAGGAPLDGDAAAEVVANGREGAVGVVVAGEGDVVAIGDGGDFAGVGGGTEGFESPGAFVGEGEGEGVAVKRALAEHAVAAVGAVGHAVEGVGVAGTIVEEEAGGGGAGVRGNGLDGDVVGEIPAGAVAAKWWGR